MTRCLNCNGIMKAGEKSCYGCGNPAENVRSGSGGFLSALASIGFVGSLFLTIASLLVPDLTPPFMPCLIASLVLLGIKMIAGDTQPQKS